MKFRISLLLLAALLSSITAFGQSNDEDGCSNATLTGDYAFRISGQILPPGGTPIDREGVAMTYFDGSGKLTQVDFVMANGAPTPGPADPLTGFHVGETGSYTVFPDCTGTAEIDFPTPPGGTSGAVLDLLFVIGGRGKTLHTIVSRLVPPNSTKPVAVSIHSDAERLND